MTFTSTLKLAPEDVYVIFPIENLKFLLLPYEKRALLTEIDVVGEYFWETVFLGLLGLFWHLFKG